MKSFFVSSTIKAPGRWQSHLFSAAGALLIATLLLMLAACAATSPTGSASNTASSADQAVIVPVTSVNEQYELAPQAGNTSSAKSYLIKVYFSQFGADDPNAVFAVDRFSPTLAVATFALQSLLAGPTLSERDAGYYTEWNSAFTGPSSCNGSRPTGGPDFKLRMNMRGAAPEQGTATVQFCRAYSSPGIGTDARVRAEITATLKQFTNIKKVVILSQGGQCIGDESGQNLCLK
jgi:spore germination protein GerM